MIKLASRRVTIDSMAGTTQRSTEEIIAALKRHAPGVIKQEFSAPEYTLEEIVTGVKSELKAESGDSRKPKNAVHVLANRQDLMAAIKKEAGSNSKFGFAGIGDNALVLTYDTPAGDRRILRITTASEGSFEQSAHVLRPHKQVNIGGLTVQHSDIALSLNTVIDDNRRPRDGLKNHAVISQSEASRVMLHLQAKLYHEGLFLYDDHSGNVAVTADGKLVTPDPGSVRTIAAHKQTIGQFQDSSARYAAEKRFNAVVSAAEKMPSATVTPSHEAHLNEAPTHKIGDIGSFKQAGKANIAMTSMLAVTAGVVATAGAVMNNESARKALRHGAETTGREIAEGILPGVTEKDTCKSIGAKAGFLGGALGAAAGVAAATGGTILGAPATGGASVAASPYTVPAAGLMGGAIGQQAGALLGESACNLARAAYHAIRPENKAFIAHKPDHAPTTAHAPDASPKMAKAPVTQGRG